MNRSRVEQILNRFSGKTILIIGDLMLDEFIWGKVCRISTEAPVPVVEVSEETYRLGGSGNVAANIRTLEGTFRHIAASAQCRGAGIRRSEDRACRLLPADNDNHSESA